SSNRPGQWRCLGRACGGRLSRRAYRDPRSPAIAASAGIHRSFTSPLLALGAVPSHADMGLSVLRPGEPEALVEALCRHVYPEHAKLDGHTTFGRFRLKLAHESGTD